MRKILLTLIDNLNGVNVANKCVIPWSCPIPSFGKVYEARLATVGLNPSNREFVDKEGNELDGADRRFHTLHSLGLRNWSDVSAKQLVMIEELCTTYFHRNPYSNWFRDLNDLISGTRLSYYTRSSPACHLDLIPYATACKWTDLTSQQRTYLLNISADVLGIILRDSPVRLLVLNGKTVVHNMERLATREFESLAMPDWTLPRHSGNGVAGYAYIGSLTELGNISLKKEVFVLGYNHNIQSSFGVTTKVKHAIGKWVTKTATRLNW